MATWLHASPAISLSALLPLLAGHSSFPTTAGKSLGFHRFFSGPLARSSLVMEVSAQARRGLSFQEDDFVSLADLCFESPSKIVEYPDPILRARNKRINTFDENLKKLVEEMFDLMYKTDGIDSQHPMLELMFNSWYLILLVNVVKERKLFW